MKLSPHATRGHLVVGLVLILLSLGSLIAGLFLASGILNVLIFFFGVWGGVEAGRYLESALRKGIGSAQGFLKTKDQGL